MQSSQRPIGFWLKRADALISSASNEALSRFGLDRTRWQLLNLLATRTSLTIEEVAGELADFVDEERLRRIIDALREDGTIEAGSLTLTANGRHLHGQALAAQQEVRARTAAGITAEEYELTISVLQRIVANLER